jgi:hypothetical protein
LPSTAASSTSSSPSAPLLVSTTYTSIKEVASIINSKAEGDVNKKEHDKKKREEQKREGSSFEEEDMNLDPKGDLISIQDVHHHIGKLSLETLKTFASLCKEVEVEGFQHFQGRHCQGAGQLQEDGTPKRCHEAGFGFFTSYYCGIW